MASDFLKKYRWTRRDVARVWCQMGRFIGISPRLLVRLDPAEHRYPPISPFTDTPNRISHEFLNRAHGLWDGVRYSVSIHVSLFNLIHKRDRWA